MGIIIITKNPPTEINKRIFIDISGIRDLLIRISANCRRPKQVAKYLTRSLFSFDSNILFS